MTEFSRGFSDDKLRAVLDAARLDGPMRSALRLWRLSGTAKDDALRLAFRNNTANLYYRGQSFSQIGVKYGRPWMRVNWKYSCPDKFALPDHKPPSDGLIRMENGILLDSFGLPTLNFQDTFQRWMHVIDSLPASANGRTKRKSYAGHEKGLIEKLFSMPSNDNIFETEITAPGISKRIDIATIEVADDGQPCVYFGEVKYFRDGRMRKAETNGFREDPKFIAEQLDVYAKWLKVHKGVIGDAYIRAANQMAQLWKATDNEGKLPTAIIQAAECKSLAVCTVPRIVVINVPMSESAGKDPLESWSKHKDILQTKFKHYPLIEIDPDKDPMALSKAV